MRLFVLLVLVLALISARKVLRRSWKNGIIRTVGNPFSEAGSPSANSGKKITP